MIKRKLGLRTIYIHLPSFYASIFVRNVRRRRIEAFFVRRQKKNAIFAKAGRDEVEELSRFLPILFETRFDISGYFPRAEITLFTQVAANFRFASGLKTFARIVRFPTCLQNLARDLFSEKPGERKDGEKKRQ